ncbi:MAG: aminotransferase class I/II-fold pyridoxal phosphate-dependent enzyme [Deltaproteobacteria bacterium]|nr:aminotransferase class I/II-fold pyridoxal phosphate-dependent enzyme [Deltaproteobacteria bacterium]
MPNKEKPKNMEAFLIHGRDVTPRWDYSHHVVPPMTASAVYRVESVERGAKGFAQFGNFEAMTEDPIYIYERIDEPTTGMLEDRLAEAEGGEMGIAFSTGMAAISAVTSALTKSGQHIISNDSVYGCTYSLFQHWMPKQGVDVDFVHLNGANLADHVKPETKIVYFESPINPTLELIDIEDLCNQVKKLNENRGEDNKILTIVDNTFASPYCQRPIEFGADFVVASLTKHISGYGTDMGGIVIGPKKYFSDMMLYRKDFGGVLSGKHAWPFLVYGLPSLPVRLRQTMATATEVAKYLSQHPKVDHVRYPGLETFPQYDLARKQMRDYDGNFAPSSILYFVLKGEPDVAKEKGAKLMNYLAANSLMYTYAVSLGHCKTLIEHPSTMTHSAISPEDQIRAGIDPGGVRIACGLEEPKALIDDMEKALEQI